MKKYIRIVLFIVEIFILPISSYFVTTGISNNENREKVEFPLCSNGMADFVNKFEAYYLDNSPWRDELVTLNSLFSLYILDESPSEDAIKGECGWYFYKPQEIEDYKCINLLGYDELNKKISDVNECADLAKKFGSDMVILVAPNKSSVYDEYMPRYIKRFNNTTCRAAQIGDFIDNNYPDVKYVYPVMELKDNILSDDKHQYYMKLDTHWNYLGGYIGCKEVLKRIEIEIPEVESLSLVERNDMGSSAYGGFDMSNMLGMSSIYKKDVNYEIDGYYYKNEILYNGNPFQTVDEFYGTVSSYNQNAISDKKCVFVRDSYGTAMYPVLTNVFREVINPHHNNVVSMEELLAYKPDIIIWETVERNMELPTVK